MNKSHAEAQGRGVGATFSPLLRASAPLCETLLAVVLTTTLTAHPVSAAEATTADVSTLVGLLELVIDADADTARSCLRTLAEKIRGGEVDAATVAELKKKLAEPLGQVLARGDNPLAADAALLAALWGDAAALKSVGVLAANEAAPLDQRQFALQTLVFARDKQVLRLAGTLLAAGETQRIALLALSRSDDPAVADTVLAAYPALGAELQPQAIELLTQRVAWAKALLAQIAAKKLPAAALNVNQVRKLLSLGDAALAAEVGRHWGAIRDGRDPAREQLVGQMRDLLGKTPGDPRRGITVFGKLCGQCHKIHGQGQEVGPDITANGRASYEQLLSNVFDPSLVIGASYQARTVRTVDGVVLTGLLVEDSEQRVVLKAQGGKLETIAREDVEAMKISELSLMPEGIEKQLQPQEIADLFAFITLDKHPDDKSARLIPGAPAVK
ncbi:MAG: c-type cytochrome [Pirellulaceae bacterium]|nr:c-type cytochrome [Pirellulaceae bacterium]